MIVDHDYESCIRLIRDLCLPAKERHKPGRGLGERTSA
jgi:hypothetical protein